MSDAIIVNNPKIQIREWFWNDILEWSFNLFLWFVEKIKKNINKIPSKKGNQILPDIDEKLFQWLFVSHLITQSCSKLINNIMFHNSIIFAENGRWTLRKRNKLTILAKTNFVFLSFHLDL